MTRASCLSLSLPGDRFESGVQAGFSTRIGLRRGNWMEPVIVNGTKWGIEFIPWLVYLFERAERYRVLGCLGRVQGVIFPTRTHSRYRC